MYNTSIILEYIGENMKILICDDEQDALKVLKEKLEKVLKESESEEADVVHTFDNTFGLLEYIERSRVQVDAVIMDINLSKNGAQNGIHISKILKKQYPEINIIFCTGNIEYAQDVFETEPLYMLLKPLDDDKLKNAVDKLRDKVRKHRDKCITIKSLKDIHRVPINDIKYVESQGRYVRVYTENIIIDSINKLSVMLETLGGNFIQCHKSYIVNVNEIKKFEYTKLTLFDGTQIAVSRKYRTEVKEALLNSI